MTVELYAGPRDGEILDIPDDCPLIRWAHDGDTAVFLSTRIGRKYAYYFPDHRAIQPWGKMRFAFHYIA